MSEAQVTIVSTGYIHADEIAEFIDTYDMSVSGMQVIELLNGEKLILESVESKLLEVVQVDDSGEEMEMLNRKPVVSYYLSKSRLFDIKDIIRIDNRGDFCIVTNPSISSMMLFNADTVESILIENCENVKDLKEYLIAHFPDYTVLKRV